MSSQLALYIFLAYILGLFFIETRRRTGLSGALWSVVIWAVVIGSRPVSTWFSFGGAGASAAEGYDSGNALERWIYFILIAYGLLTLWRRGVRWGEVIRSNPWLFLFFLYWGLSVVWSEVPFIALKRWIKDFGNVVMALVVLTESDPIEAIKAVFARCACLLVPLSVVLIRFFGDLGRAYHVWSGEMMYTGVTTHKNSLGVLALVCGLFLIWDFLDRWPREAGRRVWSTVFSDVLLIGLTLWLLLKAHSSTALACMALGLAVYFGLKVPAVRIRARNLGTYFIIGGLLIWGLNSVFDVTRWVVEDALGRDMTLTTRTEVWPVLLAENDGVVLGSGFCSFWSGERLAVLNEEYGIIQAHNGYLETFLNGGAIGVLLLLVFLFAAARTIKRNLVLGSDFARVCLMFLVISVVFNFTEAFFNKQSILWFILLLMTLQHPWLKRVHATEPSGEFGQEYRSERAELGSLSFES